MDVKIHPDYKMLNKLSCTSIIDREFSHESSIELSNRVSHGISSQLNEQKELSLSFKKLSL
jgi:hypothetical protein